MADSDDQLFKRARALFVKAIDRPVPERARWLDEQCGDDAQLRERVERLLAADYSSETSTSNADTHPDDQVPRMIGRYTIRREIASGGMGIVYEAVQDQPRRKVAVKVIRRGIASASVERRFELESQMLARLRHPNIAQVYEASTHDDDGGPVLYFAMEYIPGALSLTKFAEERRLTTRERLELFAGVCDAVHHGHQKGVIHRDLKPSNILVDSSGRPKVIDFGVARTTSSDVALTTLQTNVGQLVGTLQYMSPEQCASDPDDLDTRTDVYSLGVVLYELLTKRLPYEFRGEAIPEAIRRIREQAPERPSTSTPHVRGDVETILLTALAKDRERRYESAAALKDDILRFLDDRPIAARPPSAVYVISRFARRNKAVFASSLALILALVGATTISTTFFFQAKQSEIAARDAAIKAEKEKRLAVEAEQRASDAQEDLLVERDRAVNESRKARANRQFLGDLLGAARDLISGDDMLRLLGGSREHLAKTLADDPETRVSMLSLISSIYRLSMLHDEANDLLEEAIALSDAHFGRASQSSVVLRIRLGAGNLFTKTGRTILREATVILEDSELDLPSAYIVATLGEVLCSAPVGGLPDQEAIRESLASRRVEEILHQAARLESTDPELYTLVRAMAVLVLATAPDQAIEKLSVLTGDDATPSALAHRLHDDAIRQFGAESREAEFMQFLVTSIEEDVWEQRTNRYRFNFGLAYGVTGDLETLPLLEVSIVDSVDKRVYALRSQKPQVSNGSWEVEATPAIARGGVSDFVATLESHLRSRGHVDNTTLLWTLSRQEARSWRTRIMMAEFWRDAAQSSTHPEGTGFLLSSAILAEGLYAERRRADAEKVIDSMLAVEAWPPDHVLGAQVLRLQGKIRDRWPEHAEQIVDRLIVAFETKLATSNDIESSIQLGGLLNRQASVQLKNGNSDRALAGYRRALELADWPRDALVEYRDLARAKLSQAEDIEDAIGSWSSMSSYPAQSIALEAAFGLAYVLDGSEQEIREEMQRVAPLLRVDHELLDEQYVDYTLDVIDKVILTCHRKGCGSLLLPLAHDALDIARTQRPDDHIQIARRARVVSALLQQQAYGTIPFSSDEVLQVLTEHTDVVGSIDVLVNGHPVDAAALAAEIPDDVVQGLLDSDPSVEVAARDAVRAAVENHIHSTAQFASAEFWAGATRWQWVEDMHQKDLERLKATNDVDEAAEAALWRRHLTHAHQSHMFSQEIEITAEDIREVYYERIDEFAPEETVEILWLRAPLDQLADPIWLDDTYPPDQAARDAVNPNEAVRRARGVRALSQLSAQPYIELFKEHSEHDDSSLVRAHAMLALARHGIVMDPAGLVAPLTGEHAEERHAAARAVATHLDALEQDSPTLQEIKSALIEVTAQEDEDTATRRAALWALARFTDLPSVRAAVHCLSSADTDLVATARLCLFQMTGVAEPRTPAQWQDWVASQGHVNRLGAPPFAYRPRGLTATRVGLLLAQGESIARIAETIDSIMTQSGSASLGITGSLEGEHREWPLEGLLRDAQTGDTIGPLMRQEESVWLQVTERNEPDYVSLEDATEEIRNELRGKWWREWRPSFMASVREDAMITSLDDGAVGADAVAHLEERVIELAQRRTAPDPGKAP